MISHTNQASSPTPAGFELHDADGALDAPLFIPTWLLEQLDVERRQRARLADEERERKLAAYQAERKASQKAEEEERAKRDSNRSDATRNMAPFQAARALRVPTGLPKQRPDTVAVFDWEAARQRFETLKTHSAGADKELITRDLQHFAKAMANGPWRQIARPSDWRKELSQLAAEMPNFAMVVETIQRSLALSELCGEAAKLQPILLLGEPGVGKTHFTNRLAEVLRAPIHRQSFDNAQTNSALRGSDRHWGNTAVGALWDLVMLGETANPVVLLDELDKGASSGERYRPVEALLSVLEPVSASKVKDLSVDFEFDASHVVYVATANDPAGISAPVRSRFVEFFIQEPDTDGRLVLANSIFQTTFKRMVPVESVRQSFAKPTDVQICRLAWMTPRQIRMSVEQALGASVLQGRRYFENSDFDVPGLQSGGIAPSLRPGE
jgi:ATP-dependent Lon protease